MEIKHREEFPWLHLFKRENSLFSASGPHCCPLLAARALIALGDRRGCLTVRLSQTHQVVLIFSTFHCLPLYKIRAILLD